MSRGKVLVKILDSFEIDLSIKSGDINKYGTYIMFAKDKRFNLVKGRGSTTINHPHARTIDENVTITSSYERVNTRPFLYV